MQITIVGTGYVGLVTGTCLADAGNDVACLDIDPRRLAMLAQGQSPIYEPGLAEMLDRNIDSGRLVFTDDRDAAYADAEAVFICVGTPTGKDGRCDLGAVHAVADDLADALAGRDDHVTVVVKSTVPVGTTHGIAERIRQRCDVAFSIVNNPEFLREGSALEDFTRPDRIVCGVEDTHGATIMQRVYAPFTGAGRPLLVLDVRSSEMVKYASNAMLACKISFINEIATLCERYGADIDSVREGMCSDSRIGTSFFRPGLGYGGSCFPKDTIAVVEMGEDCKAPALVNAAVHEINQRQRTWFVDRILGHFGGSVEGRRIAMWGLAFKPRTDDVRDAPSIDIARALLEGGAEVVAYDPEASETFTAEVPDVTIVEDKYAAAANADALVVCTEWSEFTAPDVRQLRAAMGDVVIFDGRNIYDREEMGRKGVHYYSVGRPTVEGASVTEAALEDPA